jgi:hypothetical protein
MSKIFISIAAWEDKHLLDTMRDAIKNAKNPENLVFGLGLKYENEPSFEEFSNTIKIVRDKEINSGVPGIIGIRQAIRNLITDEEYFMGIDAHAEFLENWDIKLKNDIEELKLINNKTIISRQATPKFQGQINTYTKWHMGGSLNNFRIGGNLIDSNTEDYINKNDFNNKYFKNYYISCNFIFAKVEDILKISWPSYHKYPHEEPEQSLVIYCQGYNVVSPKSGYLYHFTGNDSKYIFDNKNGYDEKWWNFLGGDRSKKENWSKIWILDDYEMILEVSKLFMFGKNKYFSLLEMEKNYKTFYELVDLKNEYDRIVKEEINYTQEKV